MMEKYDGWIIKDKRGSFLLWTLGRTKSEVTGNRNLKVWKKMGHKIVKVKLMEVE